MERLPVDVMSVIFSFIRLRPRLLIVSILSKRCRSAVLRSLADLTEVRHLPASKVATATRLLPCIRSMRVPNLGATPTKEPLKLPVSLRSLEMPMSSHSCDFTEVTALTSLAVSPLLSASHFVDFVRCNSASLVSLSFSFIEVPRSFAALFAQSDSFPALQSLSISLVALGTSTDRWFSVHKIVQTHIHKLTHLGTISLTGLTAPTLRSLRLSDTDVSILAQLATLRTACTALTSLALNVTEDPAPARLSEICRLAAPVLWDIAFITLFAGFTFPSDVSYPRLAHFEYSSLGYYQSIEELLVPLQWQWRTLSVQVSSAEFHLLEAMTSLSELRISIDIKSTHLLRLPNVRSLVVTHRTPLQETPENVVRNLLIPSLEHCPRLKSLSYRVSGLEKFSHTSRQEAKQVAQREETKNIVQQVLTELALAAEKRGLEVLAIGRHDQLLPTYTQSPWLTIT